MKVMNYVSAVVVSLLMSVGLVWAGSVMASCGNWTTAWLCQIAERVGGVVLAPGLMTELYSGSKLFALMSDTLLYTGAIFLILYYWVLRRGKTVQNGTPPTQ